MRCIDEVAALKDINRTLAAENAAMVLEAKLRESDSSKLKEKLEALEMDIALQCDTINELNNKQLLLNAKVERCDDTIDMLNAKCTSQKATILSQEEELERCYYEQEEGKEYKTGVDIQALQAECKNLDRRNLQQAQLIQGYQHDTLEKDEEITSLKTTIAKLENTIEILENANSLQRKMTADFQNKNNSVTSMGEIIAMQENTIRVLGRVNKLQREALESSEDKRDKAVDALNKIDNLSAEDWFGFREFATIADILRKWEGVK